MLEKWGLSYEALSEVNPGLLIPRISGFGQIGPYRDRPGYGFLVDAVGGMLHINGYTDRAPVRAAVPVTDMTTGIYGAFGVVMALLSRGQTGKGQCIDVGLYESAFSLMESHVAPLSEAGQGRHACGLAPAGQHTPQPLCGARRQHRHGGHERFGLPPARRGHEAAAARRGPAIYDGPGACAQPGCAGRGHLGVDAHFHALRARRPAAVQRCPGITHLHDSRLFNDPHYAARGTIAHVPDGDGEPITMPAPVPWLSDTPAMIHHAGRSIGADTTAVLRELVGIGGCMRPASCSTPVGRHLPRHSQEPNNLILSPYERLRHFLPRLSDLQ